MSTVHPNAAPKPAPTMNPDMQHWEVPKLVYFVRMGERLVEALDEGPVDADGMFRAPQVLANAVANKRLPNDAMVVGPPHHGNAL